MAATIESLLHRPDVWRAGERHATTPTLATGHRELDAALPGGGWRVRMLTPDGIRIDAVWGQDDGPALPHRRPNPFNAGQVKARINATLRYALEAVGGDWKVD